MKSESVYCGELTVFTRDGGNIVTAGRQSAVSLCSRCVATMEADTHAYDQIDAPTGFLVFVDWEDASWY